jgi:hypothetical protein
MLKISFSMFKIICCFFARCPIKELCPCPNPQITNKIHFYDSIREEILVLVRLFFPDLDVAQRVGAEEGIGQDDLHAGADGQLLDRAKEALGSILFTSVGRNLRTKLGKIAPNFRFYIKKIYGL